MLATLEQTVPGFLIGSAAGIICGIVLAVVALGADYLLTSLEKRLLKWRPAAL